MKEISSPNNDTIRKVQLLIEKSRERRKQGLFVVEGIRENERALKSGFTPTWFFFPTSHMGLPDFERLISSDYPHNALVHGCSDSAFDRIAVRKGGMNVIGIYHRKETQLNDLILSDTPLVLVAEALEKPGNLGAILRTCSAAGVDALFIADGVVDTYHPQVIRNSLGGFFDVPIISSSSQDILDYLRSKQISIQVTYLDGAAAHYSVDLNEACAIVVGPEDQGVSDLWLNNANHKIKIPMEGVVDSLNVSVAAAIMLFESRRQRMN